MRRSAFIAALCATSLLSACATTGPVGVASFDPATASVAPAPKPAAPSSAAPKPSLKETARLDRELGSAVVPYPFTTCAVIQKPFDAEGAKYRRVYQGQEVLFCCSPCVRAFDANPDPYMPRIKAAAAERAAGVVAPPVVGGQ